MSMDDAVSIIAAATPPDLWTRRAGFSLMFPELLFEDERQILAGAIHGMDFGPYFPVIEKAFKRTAALVLGVQQ